jgi:hypothetical protein
MVQPLNSVGEIMDDLGEIDALEQALFSFAQQC